MPVIVATGHFVHESENALNKPPCPGSVNEPGAEKGFLCVFRGGNFGSKEEQDVNVSSGCTFSASCSPGPIFEDPAGNKNKTGKKGALVVFTTTEGNFSTTATEAEEEIEAARRWLQEEAGPSKRNNGTSLQAWDYRRSRLGFSGAASRKSPL